MCLFVSAGTLSCGSKRTDLRGLVPAETLVYLETNDLAAALQPIVDSKPFEQTAKTKPDFTALKGVQLAIALTGFETSEEALTDENSIGRVQPRFVAVAETHAWNWQAVAFAEKELSKFVSRVYDGEAALEKTDKNGGKYFTWTAKDGRKAFALVIDSLIYFANDQSAIEKCLSVRRGEGDSVAKAGEVKLGGPAVLASGYISTDGVAQIANIVGLKFASEAGDDPEIQSAITSILPQLLRGSVTDVSWSATISEGEIEDKYSVGMPPEVANIFNETLDSQKESVTVTSQNNTLLAQLPENVQVATRYNFKDPQLAWRSILLVAQKKMGALDGRVLTGFASLLFEPYGVSNAELFLSSVGNKPNMSRNIISAKLDAQADESFVIASRGDDAAIRKSLSPEFKPPTQIVESGPNIWSDGYTEVAFDQDLIKIGPEEDIGKFNGVRSGELKDIRSDLLRRLAISRAPVATIGRDTTTALLLIDMLAPEGLADTQVVLNYFTETRFTKTGMERRTLSDFGLVGSIIAQLSAD